MLRTIIYIRKSSDESSEKQIQSLERQERDIKEYLEKYNASVERNKQLQCAFKEEIDIFKESHSAKKLGRPIFEKMKKQIEKGKADVLLCHDLTRLSRNPIDNGWLIHIMDSDKLKEIRTPTNTFSNNPTDKFTLSLFLNVAKYENDQRGKNTQSGMNNRKSQGATTNKAPMGYRNVGNAKGQKGIERDVENFKLLQIAWHKLIYGGMSISEIYKYLKDNGLTYIASYKNDTETRKIPSASTIRNMFKNPYYMGKIELNGELIEGQHEAMVSEEDFKQAQLILGKRGYSHSDKISLDYEDLLKGLLVSGKSNNPFTFEKKIRYTCPCGYRYSGAGGPKECAKCGKKYSEDAYKIEVRKYFSVRGETHMLPNESKAKSNIQLDYIVSLIEKELKKIYISNTLYELIRNRFHKAWIERKDLFNNEKDKLRKDIKKKEEQIDNIMRNAIGDSKATPTTKKQAEEVMGRLREEIDTINEIITEKQIIIDESFELAWERLHALLEVKNIFTQEDFKSFKENFEPKKRLLFFIFSNLKFSDGVLEPTYNKFFSFLIPKGKQENQDKENPQENLGDLNRVQEWLPELDSNQGPTG